jgi:hypothetical protein
VRFRRSRWPSKLDRKRRLGRSEWDRSSNTAFQD